MDTICHVITKLELGGAQEVALYTISHLDPSKFRPILVTGPGGLLTDEARRLPGIELLVVPALTRQIHVFGDIIALAKLIAIFRRVRPQIVHTHSSKAGILGRWAAWLAGVPVIVHTIHGFGITPAQPAWMRQLLIWLERATGWITTHWVAVAEPDVKKGVQWGLFERNVSLIRPGINPEPFQAAISSASREKLRLEWGVGAHEWLVGTVACLKPQKAPEDFVAVAKLVCAAVPHAKFVLIGDGELRPAVESLLDKLGLTDRVRLAGWRRDIPAAMHAMDVFVLTSHWEGLPRVILEARTVGLPIIMTDVGGAKEALEGYASGWLREAADIEGLSGDIVHVLEKYRAGCSNVLRQAGQLPRQFHIQATVSDCEALYSRLLETAGRAHQPFPVPR